MSNTSFLNIERDYVLIRLIKKRIEGSPVYDSTNLTLSAPTPQNDQTHSNNFLGNSQRIVWVCLTTFWGCCFKG